MTGLTLFGILILPEKDSTPAEGPVSGSTLPERA
jgi:hypothetical protein